MVYIKLSEGSWTSLNQKKDLLNVYEYVKNYSSFEDRNYLYLTPFVTANPFSEMTFKFKVTVYTIKLSWCSESSLSYQTKKNPE